MNSGPDILYFYFLSFVGVLLPVSAVRSYRKLNKGMPFPSRRKYLISAFVSQIVTVALALGVARDSGIVIMQRPRLSLVWLLLSLGFFAALTFTIPQRWRRASEWHRRRLALLVPRQPSEYPVWALLALAAGVCEEIVWRGVFFAVLLELTHSVALATLIAALHFGLCHIVQGWGGVIFIALLAVIMQAIVLASGSLLPAMIIHFAYDLIAGIWFQRLGRALAEQPAATPVAAGT